MTRYEAKILQNAIATRDKMATVVTEREKKAAASLKRNGLGTVVPGWTPHTQIFQLWDGVFRT